MPTAKKLGVFNLGVLGVNQVESPIHLADGELLDGQNAEIYRETGELAIRKRLGIAGFVGVALAGTVNALYTVPLVDPSPPSPGGVPTGVWFVINNWNATDTVDLLEYQTGGWLLRTDLPYWEQAGDNAANQARVSTCWRDGVSYVPGRHGIMARDASGALLEFFQLPGSDDANRTFGGYTGTWYFYGITQVGDVAYSNVWAQNGGTYYAGVVALDLVLGVLSEASALLTQATQTPVSGGQAYGGKFYFGSLQGTNPNQQLGPWQYDLVAGHSIAHVPAIIQTGLAFWAYGGYVEGRGTDLYIGWLTSNQRDGDMKLLRYNGSAWTTVRTKAWNPFVTWIYGLVPLWADGDTVLIAERSVTGATITETILFSDNAGANWTVLTTFDVPFHASFDEHTSWFPGIVWDGQVRFAGLGSHGGISAWSFDPSGQTLTEDLQLDPAYESTYHLGSMYRP